MRRLLALAASVSLVVILGCGKSYERRLEATLTRMKYQQRLDKYLNPPEEGKFKELAIYLRTPKSMSPAQQPGLAVDPGAYDLIATFLDLGGASANAAEAPQAGIRLHVLARVKRPKKAPKKGEPPPPPESPRGDFMADVRSVLASELGNSEAALSGTPKADTKRTNAYKRVIFTAGNGDIIKAYFYKMDVYDVALIWDIPTAVEKETSTGVELCLESFAVGNRAVNLFQGGTDDDLAGEAGGGGGGAAGVPGGQPF
jgi:hypothetical protein